MKSIVSRYLYDSLYFYFLGNGHKPKVSAEMKSKQIDENTKVKTRGRPKKLTKTRITSKSISEKVVKNTKTPVRASKRQAITR